MTNNYSFAEKKRIRKSFEKISSVMSLPDILEIQTDSYKHFLQEEVSPDNRKEQGLENVFFYVIMFILIFFTHRENIKRLKNKEETKTKIY